METTNFKNNCESFMESLSGNEKCFCEKVGMIYSEGDDANVDEELIRDKLENHQKTLDIHQKVLDKHTEEFAKIHEVQTKLLVANAENSVKLSSIENGQYDIKKTLMENSQEQNKLINTLVLSSNENSKQKDKLIEMNQNKIWELIWKGMAIIGGGYGIGTFVKEMIK